MKLLLKRPSEAEIYDKRMLLVNNIVSVDKLKNPELTQTAINACLEHYIAYSHEIESEAYLMTELIKCLKSLGVAAAILPFFDTFVVRYDDNLESSTNPDDFDFLCLSGNYEKIAQNEKQHQLIEWKLKTNNGIAVVQSIESIEFALYSTLYSVVPEDPDIRQELTQKLEKYRDKYTVQQHEMDQGILSTFRHKNNPDSLITNIVTLQTPKGLVYLRLKAQ